VCDKSEQIERRFNLVRQMAPQYAANRTRKVGERNVETCKHGENAA